MGTRDEEYDRTVKELRGTPFIEEPKELDVDVGGACFINHERLCRPDCTAFGDPNAPTAAERCMILSGMNTGLEVLKDIAALLKRPALRPPPAPPYDPGPRRQP